jgi:tRNA(Ile2) C34 agmatinyltransferase TiaS
MDSHNGIRPRPRVAKPPCPDCGAKLWRWGHREWVCPACTHIATTSIVPPARPVTIRRADH